MEPCSEDHGRRLSPLTARRAATGVGDRCSPCKAALLAAADRGRVRLVRHPEDAQGLLLVDFPPQSFGEEVFLLDEAKAPGLDLPFGFESKDQVPLLPSARVRMSGPSRLGYCVGCV